MSTSRQQILLSGEIGFMIEIDQLGVRVMDYKNSSPEPQDDNTGISGIVCGFCAARSPEPSDDSEGT